MNTWKCANFSLDLSRRPLMMGIVNATPDSFSDGWGNATAAYEHALRLVQEGADIIDVGGESTRPGSSSVSVTEELDRVLPVIERLSRVLQLPISVDTQKPEVAQAALKAGASIVNHVSGSLDYEAMLEVIEASNAGYVVMHMQNRPKVMQVQPEYDDVLGQVGDSLEAVAQACARRNIPSNRILYDPGIGFGKTLEHNLCLLRNLPQLALRLGRPLLMGLSRKSWLNHLLGNDLERPHELDAYTVTASLELPFPAVAVHRVHNVKWLVHGFKLKAALSQASSQDESANPGAMSSHLGA